jgi:hypothetical protein
MKLLKTKIRKTFQEFRVGNDYLARIQIAQETETGFDK